MGISALLLGGLGLLLGLAPLVPASRAWQVLGAALGLLPSLCGVLVGWMGRSRALREERRVGLYTIGLALSVSATLLCALWLAGLLSLAARHRPHPGSPLGYTQATRNVY